MNDIGQKEIETQKRVIAELGKLGWTYAGNWRQRPGNRNIEAGMLREFLECQGVPEKLIVGAGHQLDQAAYHTGRSLYDRNRAVYDLLRYGVKVKPDAGEANQTVWLIDWVNPRNNHFAIVEEVTVAAPNPKAFDKRPDVVMYVNGIALGVLELKRSSVSVSNGIRQSRDSQKKEFIEPFFSTVQLVMAGNDSEGLRYGTIQTTEKYFLTWKEDGEEDNPLDRALGQLCTPERFLELIHNFVVFDAGIKKLCRHNQYFGVRAAQARIALRTGGIIWHTQGSGKSLTMVWLAKWILENRTDSRVLIVTDRTELDDQIEKVFKGVNEKIRRTRSGTDLIAVLNDTGPSLICSLIHKFGGKSSDDEAEGDIQGYIEELKKSLPPGFHAKGDLHVFVDECHRTQSGKLHEAMKVLLPGAIFIGFTGTPLLKADKGTSVETFGSYIHTYKYDEAVADGVVLDLRYEARDIDQRLGSQEKIDQWFEAKTSGLTDLAKAQLKQRWGTLREVLSCKDRLEKIVADIVMDMAERPRLMDGHGNAMLVSDSIRSACGFYELLEKTELKGKCAIVTSYKPSPNDIKGEDSGEGLTEKLRQYDIYRRMLAEWFDEPEERAMYRVEEFEKEVKEKFIEEPGQLKLLIVVDKLLTGFDAPSATYLYIDKKMQDHGLFQAICRVNRLDGEDKEYGYIIDYRDLFNSIKDAVKDYTSGALDGYDKEDVSGLLKDRLGKAKERMEESREVVKALCEPVPPPCDEEAHLRYFCGDGSGPVALKNTEPARLALYKSVAALLRAYANIANELAEAGYLASEIAVIRAEVIRFEGLRDAVKIKSGDYIDLKRFEPAMRHLIDTYVRAEDSSKISALDEFSLVDLILKRGIDEAVEELPAGLRKKQGAVAETIENNVRKLIIDETPVNPKYYERMSELLDALIVLRKQQAIEYREYLRQIEKLVTDASNPSGAGGYPKAVATSAQRALFDNLGRDEDLALAVDAAVRANRQDGFRENPVKRRKVRLAIEGVLKDFGRLADPAAKPVVGGIHEDGAEASPAGRPEIEQLVELVCRQHEY